MKQFILAVALSVAAPTLLLSCSRKSDSNNPDNGGDGEPTANYVVKGKVTDQAGNPVAGARIRAENSVGANMHIDGFSKADGTYSLQLSSIGGWEIFAWKEVEIEGETYILRMGMPSDEDYQAFAPKASGTVKNFVWKLSGRIPDRTVSKENGMGHFGGTIKFVNFSAVTPEIPANTEITVTFTPAAGATYPDGSNAAGKIVTQSFRIAAGVGQVYYINDLPLTRYVITAKAGNKVVKLGANDYDNFANSQEYLMPSARQQSKESGLGSPNEFRFNLSMN